MDSYLVSTLKYKIYSAYIALVSLIAYNVDISRVYGVGMSANTVRCHTCRGLKELSGMGGIVKKCWTCDGKGRIAAPVEALATTSSLTAPIAVQLIEEPEKPLKRKPKSKAVEPVTEDMFPVEIENKKKEIDPMMEAVLAEPHMSTEEWKVKYAHIAAITSVRDRHGMRVVYAQQKPTAPRKVDLGAMQDAGISQDKDYIAFENKEKARKAKTK